MSLNSSLPHLYGKPLAEALLRQQAEDFVVDETLNFTPSGSGEHVLLHIEKRGQNTQFVARQLAALTHLRMRDISYAGLKDRHAVTRQWFCFKWPIKADLDWQNWQLEGCKILSVQRHYRKLRLGALLANQFQITLRNVSDITELQHRAEQVVHGVPNYYGEQRFGIGGGNLTQARALFAGNSITDRTLRGLALSAARSYLFNQQIAARIAKGSFATVLDGDVLQLDGKGSVFKVEQADDTLQRRLNEGDVHVTAALVGVGEPMVSGAAAALEQHTLAQHTDLVQGLIDYRLRAERRSIRLLAQDFELSVQGTDVQLRFALPPGCFATAVLRELVNYRDCQRKDEQME